MIQKETTVENNSSPNRKISPSKGSRDLNSILRRKTTETGSPNKENFVKPYPPTNKLRQSSLEMAGVVHTSSPSQHQQQQQQKLADPPCLYKKRSIPQLQKKSSHPTLNRKSSIPTLNKSRQSLHYNGNHLYQVLVGLRHQICRLCILHICLLMTCHHRHLHMGHICLRSIKTVIYTN